MKHDGKGPSSQSYGFSSSHVWMWELDHKESWALKNWSFWTVVLEKTHESPLDCKEIQPVHPKANQSWIFVGRTDAETETPILWPPDMKNWLTGKYPDTGKAWRWEEKGMTKDEMFGSYHWLDGHKFYLDISLGFGDGQGSLACCSPWGHKELDTTEWLNWWRKHLLQLSEELRTARSLKEILSKWMTLLVVFITNFYLVAKFQWMFLGKRRWLRILAWH